MTPKRSNPDFLNGVPELLILSLLSRRPMYGYELVQGYSPIDRQNAGVRRGPRLSDLASAGGRRVGRTRSDCGCNDRLPEDRLSIAA